MRQHKRLPFLLQAPGMNKIMLQKDDQTGKLACLRCNQPRAILRKRRNNGGLCYVKGYEQDQFFSVDLS